MIIINLNKVKFYQSFSMIKSIDKNSIIIFQYIDEIAKDTKDKNVNM